MPEFKSRQDGSHYPITEGQQLELDDSDLAEIEKANAWKSNSCIGSFIEEENKKQKDYYENVIKNPNAGGDWKEYKKERFFAVPVWHGTRRTEDPHYIKTHGFSTFSCDDAQREGYLALKHFGLEHFLSKKNSKGVELRSKLRQCNRFENAGFYVDAFNERTRTESLRFDQTCSYARNNPEIIGDKLMYAGVNHRRIREYLRERFGKPYKIKLKARRLGEQINLATECKWIQGGDIESITECPEIEPKL
jgi:hypothetical protein